MATALAPRAQETHRYEHLFTNSTNLHGCFYTDEGDLVVAFRSGRDYLYKDVPERVVRELVGSSTPGQFFRENIMFGFSYEEI